MTVTESNKVFRKFPGVIICPEVRFPDYKMDKFISEINFPSTVNASQFRAKLRYLAAFYCPDVKYKLKDLQMVEYVLRHNLLGVAEAGERLTSSCEESILRCRWRGLFTNCTSLFRMEMTSYGFCCVFNARSLKRELQNYGVKKIENPGVAYLDYYGPTTGLAVVLNSSLAMKNDIDLSYKWVGLIKGMAYVESGCNGTPISPNTEIWMGFTTKNIISSEETKSMRAQLRRCQLRWAPMKYFPYYSKSNCRVECEIARTIQRCKCIPVTHPRPPNAPICNAKSLTCVKNAAVTYDSDQCDCPFSCDVEVQYTFISTFPLKTSSHTYNTLYTDFDFANISVVRIFMLHQDTQRFTRSAYFRYYDLFSQLGGVFNVFFGCSVLTVLEILQLVMYWIRDRWRTYKNNKVVIPPTTKKKKKKNQKLN